MDLLNAEEVAKLLRVSKWFIYANAETYGGFRIGKLLKFDRNTVEGIVNGDIANAREVAIRIQIERSETSRLVVSVKEGGEGCTRRTQNKTKKRTGRTDGDKYGLLDPV